MSFGLALECSGPRVSVAAFEADGRCLAEAARISAQGHVRFLTILVAEALEAAGLRIEDLDRVAVDVGPGSFTGVRVSLAAARGLARPRGLPVVGVTSFAALLEGFPPERLLVVPVLPAGGRQFYAGFFRGEGNGRLSLLRGPLVGDVPALAAGVRGALALCPRRTRVRVLGPGAAGERAAAWQAAFPDAVDSAWRPEGPHAADVGRVSLRLAPGKLARAQEVAPYTGSAGLRPLYVRRPQAVERAHETGGRRGLWDELEVEVLDVAQLDEVLPVERAVFGDPWPRRFFEDELRAHGSLARVVRHHGRLAGYLLAWAQPEEIHLGNLAVAPEYQRRGVAAFLLGWLLEEARRRGARRIALEVRTSNFAAQELYRAHGFEAVVLRRGYYQDSGEDALVMVCDLERRRPGGPPAAE